MGSIPKIVSTPVKWVSKKVIQKTLLQFPGGDSHSPIACVYCPEMCRFSCPTAVVSGNDAVTPCNKMGLLYKEEKWPDQAAQGEELWPIYDCTGCGRCTEYCVYSMPVMNQLFEARKTYPWKHARQIAAQLTDLDDPVGDLANELGDSENSQRRAQAFQKLNPALLVSEAKAAYFLIQLGMKPQLAWESWASQSWSQKKLQLLAGKNWLLHESVWMSRHLDQSQQVQEWLSLWRAQGLSIKRPFAQGRDCIDCGGEGAYPHLFPDQARQMAIEFWERDAHRADGILCLSDRCASHFKYALRNTVPIFSLQSLSQL